MSREIAEHDSRAELEQFVRQCGAFSSSVKLRDGIYTQGPPSADRRLRCFVQAISDLAGKPLNELRVLDLACYEGHYSIELALQGAQVVGIEIREANLNKARFLKENLRLDNIEFYQDDVRNLSEAKYGRFDAILCAGFLYHLDSPAVFEAIENIYSVCDRLAIFETFISLKPAVSQTYKGKTYWGNYYIEHAETDSADEKYKDLWSSIDNPQSFWLTRPSLFNALEHAGFTSAFVQTNPSLEGQPADRDTIIALKGKTARIHSSPMTDQEIHRDWTERNARIVGGQPNVNRSLAFRLSKQFLPQPVKNALKSVGTKLGLMRKSQIPDFNRMLPPGQTRD
jgi:SAM-dependent methyltransferase